MRARMRANSFVSDFPRYRGESEKAAPLYVGGIAITFAGAKQGCLYLAIGVDDRSEKLAPGPLVGN